MCNGQHPEDSMTLEKDKYVVETLSPGKVGLFFGYLNESLYDNVPQSI